LNPTSFEDLPFAWLKPDNSECQVDSNLFAAGIEPIQRCKANANRLHACITTHTRVPTA
jgi:hypothetical protein